MPDTLEEAPPATVPRNDERATFRLAVFGAVLVVTLFAGYGLGRLHQGGAGGGSSAIGPAPAAAPTGMAGMPGMPVDENQPHTHNADGSVTQNGVTVGMAAAMPAGGLAMTAGGLTLTPLSTTFVAGKRQPFRFRIAGPGGAAVTTYAIVHDKPLHLIVIRRDLSGYQHLHPTMAPDGTWSIDLTLAAAGSYRAVADFTAIVGGQPVAAALGTDLTVAGAFAPVPMPAPVRSAAADGLTVAYEGTPRTESTQPLLMTVAGSGGTPVTLQPYLGAYGHLVMFRQGDLGYVHIHPELQLNDGKVKFWVAAPGPGTYRMFFDFQVAGRVHSAAWTVIVS
jgi:hypothetical protein